MKSHFPIYQLSLSLLKYFVIFLTLHFNEFYRIRNYDEMIALTAVEDGTIHALPVVIFDDAPSWMLAMYVRTVGLAARRTDVAQGTVADERAVGIRTGGVVSTEVRSKTLVDIAVAIRTCRKRIGRFRQRK